MVAPHFNLLTIRASDVKRTVRFYAGLGLRFVPEQHGNGPVHFAASCEGLVFEIYPLRPGDVPIRSMRLGFRVENLALAIESVLEAGGTLEAPPSSTERGQRSVVVDPEGHKVELLAVAA